MERMKRLSNICRRYLKVWFILLPYLFAGITKAQYFGQNKPAYHSFVYNVYQTPHFEIYHSLDNDSLLTDLANRAELWYRNHQALFLDTFNINNPVIIYNNHADFQQTTAVSGIIDPSTGGVTEALKNRVVMPIAPSYAQTDHVLGHELVHAFQFHLLASDESLSLNSLQNLPLWMIEGMAEYLSIGSIDPHTAMWMRDALLNDDFPTMDDLTRNSDYFPYRYGHAFWAFVGKTWGDSIVVPLFRLTAKIGYKAAIDSLLGMNVKTLSDVWKSSMLTTYQEYLKDSADYLPGSKILSGENAGRINVSPAISPNGEYLVFLSEKDVFSLDLFLANIKTGKIIKKLSSTVHHNEIDALNFLESSGTWSPDSRKFAFVIFAKGTNKLVIIDIEKPKRIEEIEIPGVPSFNNPSWSPDGKKIAISGMVNGISDLFVYNLETGQVRNITNDIYSNLHPSWSHDGNHIIFSLENPHSAGTQGLNKPSFKLALLDLTNGSVNVINVFNGAVNLNPVFSPDDSSIYFLSDRDGHRNLYQYSLSDKQVFQLTDLMTGISGFTHLSPAISISSETGKLTYSYYVKNGYQIYSADIDDFNKIVVHPEDIDFTAAILPPLIPVGTNLVDRNLYQKVWDDYEIEDQFTPVQYRPKFKLDYISNVNAGVSVSRFGTGMAGSVNALFGDIVGNNQIFVSLALNGEIFDFGGQVAYLNQKRKMNWGASISHIPYYYAAYSVKMDTVLIGDEKYMARNIVLDYYRQFESKIDLFAYYPISRTRRFELGAATGWYSYRHDQYNNYYDAYGFKFGEKREKLDAPPGFSLQKLDLAYVVDNSFFGMAAPMQGHRARVQVSKYFGKLDMYSTLIDYRRYVYLRPVSIALRAYNYGRWGESAESQILNPVYLGYPWLIRGYNSNAFFKEPLTNSNLTYNNLIGSRILVTNLEVRLPISGPERLALLKSKIFLTEFNLFWDAGLAWDSNHRIEPDPFKPSPEVRVPIFSTGASIRVNLFGYAVIEPFYAIPIQKHSGITKGVFGLNFTPGW